MVWRVFIQQLNPKGGSIVVNSSSVLCHALPVLRFFERLTISTPFYHDSISAFLGHKAHIQLLEERWVQPVISHVTYLFSNL